MNTKNIAKIGVDMQMLALAGDNVKFVQSKKKNFVKQGIKNIVGIALIKETANLANSI